MTKMTAAESCVSHTMVLDLLCALKARKCITQHLDKEINYLPHSERRE